MVTPTGLFTGLLTPEMVAAQQAEQKKKTNLELSQSANPLAGSLYSSYNMADQSQQQIRDIFGNAPEDSPQVKQAKEDQALQQEIAAIMQSGLPRAEVAAKVKELLLSRNKVDKANEFDMQQLGLSTAEAKLASEQANVPLKEAQTAQANAAAEKALREKLPSFGADAEAVTRSLFPNKTYGDLTPPEAKQVLDVIQQNAVSKSKAGASNISLSDDSKLITAMNNVTGTDVVKRAVDRGTNAAQASALLSSNTPFSRKAADQVIASMFGDSTKAAVEIEALANTGSLPDRIANSVLKFLDGKSSEPTRQDMIAVSKAVYDRNKKIYENATKAGSELITKNGGRIPTYSEITGIDAEEMTPKKPKTPSVVSVPKGGIVNWADLK